MKRHISLICKDVGPKDSPKEKPRNTVKEQTVFFYDKSKTLVWCHTESTLSEMSVKADRDEIHHVLDEVQKKAFEETEDNIKNIVIT